MRIYWDCFERRIGASIIIIIVVSMCRAKSMRSCVWQLSIGLERAKLAFSDGVFDRRQGNRKQELAGESALRR